MKSPLKDRYNFKSARHLKDIIPPKTIVESFGLYAGEIELSLASADRLVVAHTNKYPIYEFWHAMKHAPSRVAGLVKDTHPSINEVLFHKLQEEWWSFKDPYYRAALFFILNRESSMGLASCGERHPVALTRSLLGRLERFNVKNFYVVLDKHEDLIGNIGDKIKSDVKLFLLGDYSFNLLGAKRERAHDFSPINHHKLYHALTKNEKDWIIVYKYKKAAAQRYKDYNITMIDEYGNITKKPERCEDLVIANY